MELSQEAFGKTESGEEVSLFTIRNRNGLTVQIHTFGATLSSVRSPDAHGKVEEVTLGFDSLDGYLGRHPYFGATVGRFANRIARGSFTLDGKEYRLFCNDGVNHLHGGKRGFDHVPWKASAFSYDNRAGVTLSYSSQDGEEGYPGTLEARVTYTLDQQDELEMTYEATTTKATPVNLTNHGYWNLKGAGSGDVKEHRVTLYADEYLPVDSTLIPTGERAKVAGTPFDFRSEKKIGADLAASGGYDHCFIVRRSVPGLQKAARVYEPSSGRGMEVHTTMPGVQFYTGNFLDGLAGRGGKSFVKHGAFCLETEEFPDAVNRPGFPSAVLRPGERYHQTTKIRFFCQ